MHAIMPYSLAQKGWGVGGGGGAGFCTRLAFLWVHELNATQKSHIPSPWLGTGVGQAAMDASSRP